MTDNIIRFPLDVDAVAARAEAAPGGRWEAFTDSLWIPWSADDDDEREPGERSSSGRWLSVREGGWHSGSEDPPPELWTFLAAARDDVLSLAAEYAGSAPRSPRYCQEGSRLMKLTIPAEELAAAASWVTAAAMPDRPTSPVLAGLLLDAAGRHAHPHRLRLRDVRRRPAGRPGRRTRPRR